MDSLIETFHIDVKLLIAQMVNFTIVLSVLYFFALKPLMKTMQDRTDKIEKSLKNAENIDKKKLEIEDEYKKVITKAKSEANDIVEKAVLKSEEKGAKMLEKTRAEIGQVINDEKQKLQAEKQEILKSIKDDVTDLVIKSVEKVLEQKIDSKEDINLIKKTLS